MVCVANGENRSETCEYALTPGSVPVPGVDQVEGLRPAAGREELAIAGGGPPRAPGKAAIGSAAWAATTMDNPRSYASPYTCQRAMRINSQNLVAAT